MVFPMGKNTLFAIFLSRIAPDCRLKAAIAEYL
jgi:hypothetical protein